VGGLQDLENRIVKAVGNPADRFIEDHLRMIRAARFASQNGFILDPATKQSMKKNSNLVEKVAPDRVRLELVKAAEKSGEEFARFIMLLEEAGILFRILPEVSILQNFKHNPEFHPEGITVFDHVVVSLEETDNMPPISKIAVLLHDIGKGVCYQEKEGKDYFSYHGHEHDSMTLAQGILDRLHFSIHAQKSILFAIENHMKFRDILEMKPSKVASIVNHEHFDVLVDVCRADEFSRGEVYASKAEFDEILEKAQKVRDQWTAGMTEKSSKKHMINGNLIMETTGLLPGRMVGEIQRCVESIILDESIDLCDVELIKELIRSEHINLAKENKTQAIVD
jgi:tRNA nucleotidyltransferase/poly(A) polymerase